MERPIHVFLIPQAGGYRDRALERTMALVEDIPGVPKRPYVRLWEATRSYMRDRYRVHAKADLYDRILHSKGLPFILESAKEFRYLFPKSMRENPKGIKLVCGGDGVCKEAVTTAYNYREAHNKLQRRAGAALEEKILSKYRELDVTLERFFQEVSPSKGQQTPPDLAPLVRALAREKKLDFDFLKGNFEMTAEERAFVQFHKLSLSSLLLSEIHLPTIGFVPGGTFKLTARQFSDEDDKEFLQAVLGQVSEGNVWCSDFRPLEIRFKGLEEKVYGSVYANGAVRNFFDLYYQGQWRSGPWKAAYLICKYLFFCREELKELAKTEPYSYEVERKDGSTTRFDHDTLLTVASAIDRLPFGPRYFDPEEGCLHAAITGKTAGYLVGMALTRIPSWGVPARLLFGAREVEHSYRNIVRLKIKRERVFGSIIDGDTRKAEGEYYDAEEVEIRPAAEKIRVVNPKKGTYQLPYNTE